MTKPYTPLFAVPLAIPYMPPGEGSLVHAMEIKYSALTTEMMIALYSQPGCDPAQVVGSLVTALMGNAVGTLIAQDIMLGSPIDRGDILNRFEKVLDLTIALFEAHAAKMRGEARQ